MRRPRSKSFLRSGQRPLPAVLLAVVLALVLAVSACGGNQEPSASGGSPSESESSASGRAEDSPTTEEEPYLPVPDGVELTAQGSQLDLGDAAVVAYEPRQDQVAALKITVKKLLDASFDDFVGWKITAATRKTNPYFVRATVKNVGNVDVGGRDVPLYMVDGNNKLIEASTFQSTFKPCPQESFPSHFKNGDKDDFCLVYLAPDKGDLTAVSFRPVEEFDPITWTGKLQKTGDGGKKGGKKGGGKKGRNKKG
jgi:hypothetical protein